jgi:hypothetical protein
VVATGIVGVVGAAASFFVFASSIALHSATVPQLMILISAQFQNASGYWSLLLPVM